VDGFVLQSVVEAGGCLRLGRDKILIKDHQTVDAPVIWQARRLRPGRYALVGVQWHAAYYDQYGVAGVSPQEGESWTVTVAPDVVTNLGVVPIGSPYAHRYVLGQPDPAAGTVSASTAAAGVGPLTPATWVRAAVRSEDSACPA
jgi:hypothetical protein